MAYENWNNTENNNVEYKNTNSIGGILPFIFPIIGIVLLISVLTSEGFEPPIDYIGVFFIIVWIGGVLWLTFSFLDMSCTLKADRSGITVITALKKKRFIAWAEVKDWGISYAGTTRDGDKCYFLYFSDECLEKKKKKKKKGMKKLKRKTIKVYVSGYNDLNEVMGIIDTCNKKFSFVDPFIPDL